MNIFDEVKNILIKQLDIPDITSKSKDRSTEYTQMNAYHKGFRLGKATVAANTLEEIVKMEEKYERIGAVQDTTKEVIEAMHDKDICTKQSKKKKEEKKKC